MVRPVWGRTGGMYVVRLAWPYPCCGRHAQRVHWFRVRDSGRRGERGVSATLGLERIAGHGQSPKNDKATLSSSTFL